MYDKFGRPHHEQLCRNSISTIHGELLDTLEMEFQNPVKDPEKATIQQIVKGYAKDSLEWIEWPQDLRCTIGVSGGYYKPERLNQEISEQGFDIQKLNYFYSARLSR